MFTGEYHHQIDEKGRIRIPAKLKDALGANPVITRGSDGCLFVFTKEKADEIFYSNFDSNDLTSSARTRAKRYIASSSDVLEEDKQGRVLLSPSLIKLAGITKNIVTIGAYDRVEIWSEERWNAYIGDSETDFDECLKSLEKNNE